MEEVEIYKLISRQKALAEELTKLKINLGKDGPQRKTPEYRDERLRRIDAIWAEFSTNHQRLAAAMRAGTPYIQGDTVGKVEKLFLDVKAVLEAIAPEEVKKGVDASAEAGPSTQEPTDAKPKPIKRAPQKAASYTPAEEAESSNEEADDLTEAGPSTQRSTDARPKPIIRVPQEATRNTSTETTRLIRRQRLIADSLRRLLAIVDATDTTAQSKSFFELKIQGINKYWTQMEELHQDLGELTQDYSSLGYDIKAYIELEEQVQEVLVWLATKLEAPMNTHQQVQQAASSMLQLPKITIPEFDGDYGKWRQFSDLYLDLVHKQPLSNCQKMWYLKTSLKGEAERLLRHLALSDDNYNAAWKILQDRYENPRLLVASLVNKLLNQPGHVSDQPSTAHIKTVHDTTRECLMGLENLKVSTSTWDPIILPILYKKIDRSTHALYEQSLASPRELQSITEFLNFLETRFQSLEALGNKGKKIEEFKTQTRSSATLTTANKGQQSPTECIVCNKNHALYHCNKFLQMSPANRNKFVSQEKLCKNCLKKGHFASNCTLRGCKICSNKHNSLLHVDDIQAHRSTAQPKGNTLQQTAHSSSSASAQKHAEPTSALTTTSHTKEKFVILGTARVRLTNNNGTEIECRALLDSGSQINIISDRAVKRLGLVPSSTNMRIQGIGHGRLKSQKRVNVLLSSKQNAFSTRLEAFVLHTIIAPQPSKKLDISSWNIPHNIQLADPTFHESECIDVLLGTELIFQLLSIGQISLGKELPTLQNTVFGWIVAGGIEQPSPKLATCGTCSGEEQEDINATISRFWDIEQPEAQNKEQTIAERRCETYFEQTCKRDSKGRFVVRLPFSDDPKILGQSKDTALRRFLSIERRLMKQPELRHQYTTFMEEYDQLGHMEEVNALPTNYCFLPHHCVLKPESSSTKLRVVFDASAKTHNNISLNNILYTGPVIQDELFNILLRFRLPRFVFTADIEKIYRQIRVDKRDTNYQLIWWRRNQEEKLRCYRLNTITYGTSAAPYLAIKCLQRLAQEECARYPIAADVLLHNFYVDDVMTGADSIITARDMQSQLVSLLNTAGFKLRKWCANHSQLLNGIAPEEQEVQLNFSDEKDSQVKTLRLTWLPKADNFCLKINVTEINKITKRTVASDIARLFDPLGLFAPVVVTAKIYLQELWALKQDWDAALPIELHTRWSKFRNSLLALEGIQVPRHVFGNNVPISFNLHAFADASEKSYAAAIYIRSTDVHGRVIVRLLCSKSRVAPPPPKKITLPRLELCAAELAAKLLDRVKRCLRIEKKPTYMWTDSGLVLAWINSTSGDFQAFVVDWGVEQCRSIHVHIQTPPRLRVDPASVTLHRGDSLRVRCLSPGNDIKRYGQLGYSWTRNGVLFQSDPQTVMWEDLYPDGSILKINNIQPLTEVRTYFCGRLIKCSDSVSVCTNLQRQGFYGHPVQSNPGDAIITELQLNENRIENGVSPSASDLKSAEYSCVVSNSVSPVSKSVYVTVIDRNIVELCHAEKNYAVRWPTSAPGAAIVSDCPKKYQGFSRRVCEKRDVGNSTWLQPDFSHCVADQLLETYNKFQALTSGYQKTNFSAILKSCLEYTIKRHQKFLPGEAGFLMDLLQEVDSYLQVKGTQLEREMAAEIILHVLDKVMQNVMSLNSQQQIKKLQFLTQSAAFSRETIAASQLATSTSSSSSSSSSLSLSSAGAAGGKRTVSSSSVSSSNTISSSVSLPSSVSISMSASSSSSSSPSSSSSSSASSPSSSSNNSGIGGSSLPSATHSGSTLSSSSAGTGKTTSVYTEGVGASVSVDEETLSLERLNSLRIYMTAVKTLPFNLRIYGDDLFSDQLYMDIALSKRLHNIMANSTIFASVISYKNLKSFLPNTYYARGSDSKDTDYVLASRVVQTWLFQSNRSNDNLRAPLDLPFDAGHVEIIFQHESRNTNSDWIPVCGHDYKATFESTWRTDLCITKNLMENITRCICPLSGTFVVLLAKKNYNTNIIRPSTRPIFVIVSCGCCFLLSCTAFAILLPIWYNRKCCITFLKMQFCTSTSIVMVIFLLGFLKMLPQDWQAIISSTLASLMLLGISTIIAIGLVVHSELVPRKLQVTNLSAGIRGAIGISWLLPLLFAICSPLISNIIGKWPNHWWLEVGSSGFILFIVVEVLFIVLFGLLLYTLIRKLLWLLRKHDKHGTAIWRRIGLLYRTGIILFLKLTTDSLFVAYLNTSGVFILSHIFGVCCILLGFSILICFVIKAEYSLRSSSSDPIRKASTKTSLDDNYCSGSINSPLSFYTNHEKEKDNESGAPLQQTLTDASTTHLPLTIISTAPRCQMVTGLQAAKSVETFLDMVVVGSGPANGGSGSSSAGSYSDKKTKLHEMEQYCTLKNVAEQGRNTLPAGTDVSNINISNSSSNSSGGDTNSKSLCCNILLGVGGSGSSSGGNNIGGGSGSKNNDSNDDNDTSLWQRRPHQITDTRGFYDAYTPAAAMTGSGHQHHPLHHHAANSSVAGQITKRTLLESHEFVGVETLDILQGVSPDSIIGIRTSSILTKTAHITGSPTRSSITSNNQQHHKPFVENLSTMATSATTSVTTQTPKSQKRVTIIETPKLTRTFDPMAATSSIAPASTTSTVTAGHLTLQISTPTPIITVTSSSLDRSVKNSSIPGNGDERQVTSQNVTSQIKGNSSIGPNNKTDVVAIVDHTALEVGVNEQEEEDSINGMLDRISHDLDYLLNRTNEIPPRLISGGPSSFQEPTQPPPTSLQLPMTSTATTTIISVLDGNTTSSTSGASASLQPSPPSPSSLTAASIERDSFPNSLCPNVDSHELGSIPTPPLPPNATIPVTASLTSLRTRSNVHHEVIMEEDAEQEQE